MGGHRPGPRNPFVLASPASALETWRLLAGMNLLLVRWAAAVLVVGQRPRQTVYSVELGAAVLGLYLGCGSRTYE